MKNKEVTEYFNKQEPDKKKICLKLRKIIFDTFPDITEEMNYGAPFYGGKFYIGAVRIGVNLGFMIKGLSKKELELFSGKGELARHLKFESVDEIDEKEVVKLLKLVWEKGGGDAC